MRAGLRHPALAWLGAILFAGLALRVLLAVSLWPVGLITSRGRAHAGVVLFGLGGLALIVSPALSGSYSGRYFVLMAGTLVAAAAIAVRETYRRIAPKTSTMGHHAAH